MKQEYLIAILSTLISCVLALIFLLVSDALSPKRATPLDLQVVRLEKKQPAFLQGVFRESDYRETGLLVLDPIVGVRGRPQLPAVHGFGPHDILGFRNRALPRSPDIIAVGDSQTYGNNALSHESWPKRLQEHGLEVYSAAVGGWSPLHYVEVVRHLSYLAPTEFIVAVYTGNDALEAFRLAYTVEYWKGFREEGINGERLLEGLKMKPDEREYTLQSGGTVKLTPARRLLSNASDSVAVQQGHKIIKRALSEIFEITQQYEIGLRVVVIPTKEYAFRNVVTQDQMLKSHIESEQFWIKSIVNGLDGLGVPNVTIDLSKDPSRYYPPDRDGHPLPAGYQEIARQISVSPKDYLLEDGYYRVTLSASEEWYLILRSGKLHRIASEKLIESGGLSEDQFTEVPYKRIARYPLESVVRREVDLVGLL